MKKIRLENNIVAEIIPIYALPVEKWYGKQFADTCIDAPDEVECGMIYKDGIFIHPVREEPTPMLEERNRADIDYLALMGGVVL